MSKDGFRWLAPIYESCEWLYSGGAIAAAKKSQWSYFQPGMRICYAGVGAGGELAGAAAKGVEISLIDTSPSMLRQAVKALPEQAVGSIVEDSVLQWQPDQPFHGLVTNFFLNIFAQNNLELVLDRLVDWVEPGGFWTIADFAPPSSLVGRFYWGLPLRLAAPITGEEVHPFYDYVPMLEARGFALVAESGFRIWGIGPTYYRVLHMCKESSILPLKETE